MHRTWIRFISSSTIEAGSGRRRRARREIGPQSPVQHVRKSPRTTRHQQLDSSSGWGSADEGGSIGPESNDSWMLATRLHPRKSPKCKRERDGKFSRIDRRSESSLSNWEKRAFIIFSSSSSSLSFSLFLYVCVCESVCVCVCAAQVEPSQIEIFIWVSSYRLGRAIWRRVLNWDWKEDRLSTFYIDRAIICAEMVRFHVAIPSMNRIEYLHE